MLRLLAFCLLYTVLLGSTEAYLRRACEGHAMSINCGARVIDILSASYGRTQLGLCGHMHSGNTNCHAGVSWMVARHECQGQRRCTLHAKNSAFGDPCHGTGKYLEVRYQCVMGTSCEGLLLRICENHSGAIHCHKGNINIISVNYGRLIGGHICPGVVKTQNCGAAGSLGQVRRVCQGKQYCILYATNGHFGDPCHGTTKYLEVRYKCEP